MSLYTDLDECKKQKKMYEDDNKLLRSVQSDITALEGQISSAMSGMRGGSKASLKEGLGGVKGNSHQMLLNSSLALLDNAKSKASDFSSSVSNQITTNEGKISNLNSEISNLEQRIRDLAKKSKDDKKA